MKLILLQGIPGSGKSTFVASHKLQPYTISPDALRLMYSGLDENGKISQEENSLVWNTVFRMLHVRMSRALPTIIDATHTTQKSVNAYKNYCLQHEYTCYIIKFEGDWNKSREHYKVVNDDVVERMKEQLIKFVKPDWISGLEKPENLELYIK